MKAERIDVADIEGDTYRYQNQSGLNYNTLNYGLAWDWQFTPKFHGTASADRRQFREVTTDLLTGANLVGRRTERNELVDANYTFLNRHSVNPSGILLPGTPKHKEIGSVSYRTVHQILLLAIARYEAGRISQNDAGYYQPASNFATADLGIVVPVRYGLDLQSGVRNLFDRNYFYVQGYPEPGRNWYFNVRYRF